ncbi:hypothetical protein Hanom_Chr14g01264901 [Helianthus anomalus]
MIETWWIRRWYFLYISVYTMLLNFRTTCHSKFGVLRTYGENAERFVLCET